MNQISSDTYQIINVNYSSSEFKDVSASEVPTKEIISGEIYRFVNITYSAKELGDSSTSKILWIIKKIAKDRNVPLSAVAQPLRVALTGGTKSPPIDDVWDILGEEKSLKRIEDALKQCGITI
jgi:glutamyl/glutaminyl-tRNA synthetase